MQAEHLDAVIDTLVEDVAAHDWHLDVGIVGVKPGCTHSSQFRPSRSVRIGPNRWQWQTPVRLLTVDSGDCGLGPTVSTYGAVGLSPLNPADYTEHRHQVSAAHAFGRGPRRRGADDRAGTHAAHAARSCLLCLSRAQVRERRGA